MAGATVSTGQARHTFDPGTEYVPTAHAEQVPATVSAVPAGQSTQAVWPPLGTSPSGQLGQLIAPANEKVSPTQSKHSAVPGVGANVPGAQVWHDDEAIVGASVPGAQSRHCTLPGVGAKRPVGHGRQLCWSAWGW